MIDFLLNVLERVLTTFIVKFITDSFNDLEACVKSKSDNNIDENDKQINQEMIKEIEDTCKNEKSTAQVPNLIG